MRTVALEADLLILGGGAAGCWAALTAARLAPAGTRILLAEKAHIERSGCLAAGINAINAYIGAGHTPEDYVEYARKDAEGIVRQDLLLTMACRLNAVARSLEDLGLVIQKDGKGRYAERGWRNIRINGENIKPLLAGAVSGQPSVRVLNRVNATAYLLQDGRVTGATAFGVTEPVHYVLRAPAVLCATGGAAGLYRPNSPGLAGHALWYPPFNTGAGYAMGILAGAEMTGLEMRFVALRCRGTAAPTGTLALGAGARQVNARGEAYEKRYGLSTSQRVFGFLRETLEGRGPCCLLADNLDAGQVENLYRAYLNMAPAQTLSWLEEDAAAGEERRSFAVAVEGTEPYIVGGHTAAGYWVDVGRRATLPGLFAAGDVAGGCPQKYASGAMAEAEIAAASALAYAREHPLPGGGDLPEAARRAKEEAKISLGRRSAPFTADHLEEAMQQAMDQDAGGISAAYSFTAAGLNRAEGRIRELSLLSESLRAADMRELLRNHELRERLLLCRCLLAHLRARKETRWPGFALHLDYPRKDDAWLVHVNSRLEGDAFRMIFRKVAGTDEKDEHSH